MGMTMSIMTQRLYIAVSFWVFLNIAFHSTKETPVCPFRGQWARNNYSGKIYAFSDSYTLVIKGLSQDYL